MNQEDKDKWAKAHFEHGISAHHGSVTSRRASDAIRTSHKSTNPYRALYDYDYGASDLRIVDDVTNDGIAIHRNAKKIAHFCGTEREMDAALMVQASAMRNMLIDVLSGACTHAQIHELLQKATLKR